MLKIFKILVTGIEGRDGIGINSTVRTTMGYDETKKEISLLVEQINLPEVPTDKTIELRDPHTTATFTTLLSRIFTPDDFPKTGELQRWQVDYDVVKNELVIFDAYEYGLTKITNSQSARKIARFVKERYNHDLIPLFVLDNFYKSAPDFTASVLTFYTDEQDLTINDTILTLDNLPVTVTQQEKERWLLNNLNLHVSFEILDGDKIISSNSKFIKPEAKSLDFIKMDTPNLDLEYAVSNPADPVDRIGGQFKLSLPAKDLYTIRVKYFTDYIIKTLPVKFDVICINGIANKSRLTSGWTQINEDVILQQHTSEIAARFVGLDNIQINTAGLVAGDFVKLKLNLGNFKSYAELWIVLT